MAPLEQVVPAASACQTTLPPLHRPNCVGPLQTTAPSVLHCPELPVLPEEEAEEPVGADEPVEGPETPWPRVGERVGYADGVALEAGTVNVLKVDGGAAEEALDAGTVAEGAALKAVEEVD
jgi:hypothetical protein